MKLATNNQKTWQTTILLSAIILTLLGLAQPVFCLAADRVVGNMMLINDNGGWTWYTDEKIFYDPVAGNVLTSTAGEDNGFGGVGGARLNDVDATTFNIATGKRTRVIHRDGLNGSGDDHSIGAFWIRPDGRYMHFMCPHYTEQTTYYRLATNPNDGSAWGSEQSYNWLTIPGSPGTDTQTSSYTNIFYLSGEGTGNGRLYNIHRVFTRTPCLAYSDDLGQTWQYMGRLNSPVGGATYSNFYIKARGNGVDRIDFIGTEQHPRNYNNSIFHGYIKNGKSYNSFGVELDTINDQNAPSIQAYTPVFLADQNQTATSYHTAWTNEMEIDSDGRPAVLFQTRYGTATYGDGSGQNNIGAADHRFFYGRFNGTTWTTTELCKMGTGMHTPEQDYLGMGCINPDDVNEIYISTNFDPVTDVNIGRREIFKGVTADNGLTWNWTQITIDSTVDNIRPAIPQGHTNNKAVFWTRGVYPGQENYDFVVVGTVEEKNATVGLVSYTDANTSNTTDANGSAFSPTGPSGSAGAVDSRWHQYTGYGNTGSCYTAGDSGTENVPAIKTTLTGLANGTYDVFAYFWCDPNADWGIRGGFTSSDMLCFNKQSSQFAEASQFSGSVTVTGTGVQLYRVYIGRQVVSGGTPVVVYLDNYDSTYTTNIPTRTTYDGVGVASVSYVADTTPPTPNPMTWASVPTAAGAYSITMTATTATDLTYPPVQYFFECTTDANKNSAWLASPTYKATGLRPLTQYTFRVKARDSAPVNNETGWSITGSAVTTPTIVDFVSAGALTSGTAAITPALPSDIEVNDILLLTLETANQTISISNQNGGTWAQVTNSPQGTGTAASATATSLTVFWSRYNGTQGAPTTSDSGDHQIGRITAYRGVVASGNPWDVTAGGVEAVSDTSGSIPGATTTVNNTLIVAAIATALPDACGTIHFSAWANGDLTQVTERIDNAWTAGNGGGLGIATGKRVAAGAYGSTTATLATSAYKGMMSIALKPQMGVTSPPGAASSPSPTNGATGVSTTTTLSWTAGPNTVVHDVYFGTNPTPGVSEFKGSQTGTTYNPGTLLNNTIYYWRIDEKNAGGATTGTVWSFTTSSGVQQRSLTTSASSGGTLTTPGIGTYWYNQGTDANIVASASTGYHFINWTGTAVTAGKVANPNLASTKVTIDANYTVQANFALPIIPDVTNTAQAAAEAAIVAATFTVGTETNAYSNTVALGNVISQNPAGGTAAPSGTSVNLVISLGKPVVPNVVGMTQAAAAAAITAVDNLTVGTVTQAYSDTVAAGLVISQTPVGGTQVNIGSSVDLVVSLGLPIIPDVTNTAQAAAEAAIVAAAFTVGNVTTAYSDTVAAGNVISQSPIGGTAAVSGTAVDMVVSLGLPIIPDVTNTAQAAAEAAIVAATFTVGNVTTAYSDTVAAGNVISQSLVGPAVSGTAVDMVVSLGLPIIPDVTNTAQAAAEAAIVAAAFTVGNVTTAYSDTVAAGNVISQSLVGPAVSGTAVDMVVSLGLPIIPDVTNTAQAAAEAAIVAAAFTVGNVTTAYSDTVAAGNVISQSPIGGTAAVSGTAVDMVVSLGLPIIPDVTGQAQAAAEAAIVAATFTVGNVTTAYSDTVAAGNVISQSLVGPATSGTAVDMVVSLGLPIIPDVTGQAQAAAEAAIVAATFTVGNVTTAYSDTVAAGNVISQSPIGGTAAVSGTAVDMVVSLGLPIIPDVTNTAQAVAEAAIVAATFTVGNVTTAYSDTVAAGNVISQSLVGPAVSGTAVDMVVSLGLPIIPDVTNTAQAAAEAAIVAATFTVGNVTTAYSDTVAAGNVISQSPIGGTAAVSGTAVDMVVSLGLPIIPDVTGQAQAAAEAAIVAATFTVGNVTTAYSDTVAAGNVISQSLVGPAVSGTAVDMVVSDGPSSRIIFGYIKNECNVPIEGVLVDANNGGNSDTTDANGYYEVWVDYNWSGTVTPSKAHYTFDPNSMLYANVLGDIADQNYVANNIYDLDCDGTIGYGDVAVISENWIWSGDLKPNCVGHWKLNDNAANTTVLDGSGTSHNGTASRNTNLLAAAGKINGAFLFNNGTSDYVAVQTIGTGSYTKAAWVNLELFTGAYSHNILSGGNQAFFAPEMYSHKLSAGHNNIWNQVQDPNSLAYGVWYFVAVTYNAGTNTLTLYKNGAVVSTGSTATPAGSSALYIGRYSSLASSYYKGLIDNVMLFNRALTGEEISLLYNNGNGVETITASGIDGDFNNDGTVNFLDFAEFSLAW